MAEAVEVQAVAANVVNKANQAQLAQAVSKAGAPSGQAGGDATKMTFSSAGEFKAKFPELYEAFMNGAALAAVYEAKNANDRLIRTLKEAERQG